MIDRTRPAAVVRVSLPGLARGRYSVFYWDTEKGRAVRAVKIEHSGTAALSLEPPPFAADLAIAVRKL